MLITSVVSAQRVQFPSQVPEGSPYTAAPSAPAISTPPPGFDPYATGAPGAVPGGAPPPGQPATFYGTATRFLQEIDFDSTFLQGSNTGNHLGVTDLETSATFAIPIFRNPFLVTPGFAAHFWNGPTSANFSGSPDMPPETYDAYLDTTWKPQISERFSADLAFRAGIYTDFNYVTSRSVRFPARGLGIYSFAPNFQVAAGIVYLDRISVRLLPAGGVIWMPNPDARFELLFPRPKLSQRIATVRNGNLWGFVEGEYGGNTWTIRRTTGSLAGEGDLVDYNDLRLSLGVEYVTASHRRGLFEVGYVFNRRLQYRDGTPKAFLHDTFMIRSGIAF